MADYSDEILMAYNDIKDAGVALQIKRWSGGTYDPVTEAASGATWASDSTYGVIEDYSETVIDGTLIQLGDKRIVIPAYGLTFTLQKGDIVVIDSIEWKVVDPHPIMPDGTPIIYKTHVRG